MRRRAFLGGLGSLGLLGVSGPAWASVTDARFVLVLLRGGLDGLSVLVPHGDPDHARARRGIQVEDPLDLDGFFGLHPALAELTPLWDAGDLLPLHAVSLPYGERSHFDAQDLLENGTSTPHGARDGWLGRALGSRRGLAIGKDLPLVLRGDADVASLDPTRTVRADDAFFERVSELYVDDPVLGPALSAGLAARQELHASTGRARRAEEPDAALARSVASMLRSPTGPTVAVLEMGGWDTHARQAGVLNRQLAGLSAALMAFRNELGPAWDRTVVLACTEFGRTVAQNGTKGTDHGTASAALLAGGPVRGGRVLTDWPGLSKLADGRDLRGTLDLRSVFKGVLHDHLQVASSTLESTVFPDSAAAPRLTEWR